MANTKSKKSKKTSTKPKAADKAVEAKVKEVKAKEVKTEEVKAEETKKTVIVSATQKSSNPLKGFFDRKFDASENILTIFKRPSIYAALIGEAFGVMVLTVLYLTLGVYQPLYIMLIMVGVTAVTFGLSGANLNPIVTVGMMATRRMSAIRGVLYILAQILGAWFGYLICSAFISAGGDTAELNKMTAITGETFWMNVAIEVLAACIFAFVFARALAYKRSALTFATIIASGLGAAILISILISSNYLALSNNFVSNPAIALMYQILPTSGADFGEIFGNICLALGAYAVFPMVGGVAGFYLADASAMLAGECVACGEKCNCKK